MLFGHAPLAKLGGAAAVLLEVDGATAAVVGGVETVALGGGDDFVTLDSAVVTAVGDDWAPMAETPAELPALLTPLPAPWLPGPPVTADSDLSLFLLLLLLLAAAAAAAAAAAVKL